MIKELIKISNKLDLIGLTKEADELDGIIRKMSQTRADIDPDQISEEDTLAGHAHPLAAGRESMFGGASPEQRLIDLMHAVKIIKSLGDKSAEKIAEHYGFGENQEMIRMIDQLMKGLAAK